MNGWRPIETAPKDGSWILVYDPIGLQGEEDLTVLMAQWNEKEWHASFGQIEGYSFESDSDSWISALIVVPTHWMPLPEPPA